MDQQKIGAFLKVLRKQKGVTQEQLADMLHVSNRTVSRWENGSNLPDLDLLIELSDYYEVELRELLDGEKRNSKMNQEMKETVIKAVDYTSTKTAYRNKKIHWLLMVGLLLMVVSQIIDHTPLNENETLQCISAFLSGAACGMIILGIVATSRFRVKLEAFRNRLLKKI